MNRDIPIVERAAVGLAVLCLAVISVVALQFEICRTRGNAIHKQDVIRITGFAVPSAETDDYLVYSDHGVYTVSDQLLQTAETEYPWFLFELGKQYSVVTQGEENGTWLTSLHPEISQFEEVTGTSRNRISFSE